MDCPNCGAAISAESGECQFCGTAIMATAVQERESRFERIKNSPEYQRKDSAERVAALPEYSTIARAFPMIFSVVFIGISGLIGMMALCMGAVFIRAAGAWGVIPMLLLIVIPVGFIGVGVYIFQQFRKKMQDFDAAPVVARPAVIVVKRTQVTGGSGDSSARTQYHVTAEFEDGTRNEFQTMTNDLYGRVAEQDMGILFTRSALALDFDRVNA